MFGARLTVSIAVKGYMERCPNYPNRDSRKCNGIMRSRKWKAWTISKCTKCTYGGKYRAGANTKFKCKRCKKPLFKSGDWLFCTTEGCKNYQGFRDLLKTLLKSGDRKLAIV